MDPSRLREMLEARFPAAPGWEGEGLSAAEIEQLQAAAADDPALLAELGRIEAWDVELDRAFHDLPIPVGLADRLLTSVQSQSPLAEITADASSVASDPVHVAAASDVISPKFSRRAWLALASSLAAVVLVGFGVSLWPGWPRYLSTEALLAEARSHAQNLNEDSWQNNLQAAPLDTYPATPSLLLARPLRWQALPTSLDRQTVVYDLVGEGRKRAVLMVSRAVGVQSDLTALPIRTPESTTEGFCLGAWQQGDLVYVLVVEGSAARYASFIKEVSTG